MRAKRSKGGLPQILIVYLFQPVNQSFLWVPRDHTDWDIGKKVDSY